MAKSKNDMSNAAVIATKSPLDALEEMYEARFGVNAKRFPNLTNRKAGDKEKLDGAPAQQAVISSVILLATACRPN